MESVVFAVWDRNLARTLYSAPSRLDCVKWMNQYLLGQESQFCEIVRFTAAP
jgi:hypothetical protein